MLADRITNSTFVQKSRGATTGKQVAGSLRFDWVMALLTVWLVVGIHVDGWAHQHIPELETFFTPWHGLFYSAFGVTATVLSVVLLGNHFKKGYAWTKALPAGYELSFLGLILFFIGGIGDMLWHTFLGIEVSVEALLSPTHLLLATGGMLIVSGPLRSAWKRAGSKVSFANLLPMLLSLTMMFSLLTFFTQYGHPFGTTWAGPDNVATSINIQNYNEGLATISTMFQSALLVGVTLLLLRRWALPFGSLTLIYTVNIALLTFMRDLHLSTGKLPLILVALVTGLIADGLVQWLKPSVANRAAFRLFAFVVPVVLFGLYDVAVALSGNIWWTVPVWAGGIFLAGIAGWLISYIALPPVMPTENGLSNNQ